MFIFDVNTPYKHSEILGNNTYIYDIDGVYCVWQNEYNEADGSVSIALDFFEEGEDGRYERFCEGFKEIAFDDKTISAALEEAGFEILDRLDDYTDLSINEKTQRIVYVCRKTARNGG